MLVALVFIAIGAMFLVFPGRLARLYADSPLGRRYRFRRRDQTLFYWRVLGAVLLAFGAFIAWTG